MKMTVDFNLFVQAFADCGRSDNFSGEGLGCLFEHLEELERDLEEEYELDVIALCCDFTEYSSAKDVIALYDHRQDFADLDPDNLEALNDLLRDYTSVVCCEEGCIVIQDF